MAKGFSTGLVRRSRTGRRPLSRSYYPLTRSLPSSRSLSIVVLITSSTKHQTPNTINTTTNTISKKHAALRILSEHCRTVIYFCGGPDQWAPPFHADDLRAIVVRFVVGVVAAGSGKEGGEGGLEGWSGGGIRSGL